MTALDEATLNQIGAADPTRSTWLTANAGSGKTKVLTDRVTRLLLNGVDPECVLCLTYTKAAAAEMQNRLFRRLGDWAMMPDAKLLEELQKSGVTGEPDLGHARTLFARAIETPGGIKIQTIHAFCAMLLRRFPLEAGVSPGFRELDDAEAAQLRNDIVDRLAERGAPEVAAVAAYLSTDDIGDFSASIVDAARHFPPELDRQKLADCMGVPPDISPEHLLRDLLGNDAGPTLGALKSALAAAKTGPNDEKALKKIAALDPDNVILADHARLEGLFLTGESAKSGAFAAKTGSFPTKASRQRMGPDAAEALDAMMSRAERLREPRLALAALEKADALRRFAQAFLPAYEAAKLQRGVLDFADLISRASSLLSDRSVAEWVLYRIDGTIDHILVDEAQDTSPGQWDVIERLAAEMTAGQGSRPETARTLFVVGDLKQSIYSFQGADPRVMDDKRAEFQARLEGGTGLANRKLFHSFRSARAILDVVDRTFTGPRAQGLGDAVAHEAFHETMPGRVDLWPLETRSDAAEEAPWYEPVDRVLQSDPTARLARRIASEIGRWVETETIPAKKGGFRPVVESDVLILVQRRNALFHQIIRACKTAGLTVAGADRLRIQSELAARDIMAVLAFLALPEDDLALATVLRSPLFGWSESELFRLAQPRKGYLWTALRASGAGRTLEVLHDLLDQSDFLRPFELIERLLTRHGGRARLLARLGPEAEEGIDALLNEAMRYEQSGPPSLNGFVAWYEAQDTDIKRQTAGAGAGIRVMTVHGAKGLESPIVILPDTLRDQRERPQTVLPTADGIPLWSAPRAERPAALAAAARRRKEADEDERRRLLYVAMTRAESWLVVAGAGAVPKNGETWYEAVSDGMEAAHAATVTFPDDTRIKRYETGDWSGPVSAPEPEAAVSPEFPVWVDGPDRAAPKRERPLSPSDLGGDKFLAGEPAGDAAHEDPLTYGTRLHLLLEHLPGLPPRQREAGARALLPEMPAPQRAALVAEALHLIEAPDLSEIFSPRSLAEVAFSCQLDGRSVQGTIDRLIVTGRAVLAVDFKSNRVVPDRPENVPEGLLRQMGAYAHALAEIYPGRQIDVAILWTSTAALMHLPDDIVRQALARAATS